MKIGAISKNYAAIRLYLNKIDGATYKDVRYNNWYLLKNIHLWILRFLGKLNMSPEEAIAKLYYDFSPIIPTGCNIIHFFNCINHSKTQKWVISVETALPWTIEFTRCVERKDGDLSSLTGNIDIAERLECLARPNCLGIMTLSKSAESVQREILKLFPEYESAISRKLITLHPAQELLISNVSEKGLTWSDEELFTFIYVGKHYYRKGGRESVEVLTELRKKYKFKLILISALEVDEQKYLRTDKDEEIAKRLIEENKDWIEYYPGLPNNEVLDKMIHSHVCLLPTWMDTYAYSVLESQACGTPLISTAMRAMIETNTEEVGWPIQVPTNKFKTPIHATKEEQDIFYFELKKGLREQIEYVLTHRSEVKAKSQKCLERIAKYHNPIDYANKLDIIYKGNISQLLEI